MYMVIEVPDEKSGIASQMFGKDINIIHEPDVGWMIYGAKVVGLSVDYPGSGEEVD